MSLTPLVGHSNLRSQISRAIQLGSLPQVLLITGAPGVGKQRLAIWIAQRLLCQSPGPVEPCGRCANCIRVLGLAHPDFHWVMPIPRPKAAESDKQVEEVSEAVEEIIAERRKAPFWGRADGMASHGIASARYIQRRAAKMSVEGGAKVFLIAEAERLVPQESSQEAANALLKLLEEPSPGSFYFLTATAPGQVLPTIRSRSIPLRVDRLSDADVLEFLSAHRAERATPAIVAKAHGSIGKAQVDSSDDGGKSLQAARSFLEAAAAGPGPASERALRQGPWQARGDFTLMLDALASHLVSDARETITGKPGNDPMATISAVDCVAVARERAQGNVNPQLLLAVLADELNALGVA